MFKKLDLCDQENFKLGHPQSGGCHSIIRIGDQLRMSHLVTTQIMTNNVPPQSKNWSVHS